jgi:hypothetical protein
VVRARDLFERLVALAVHAPQVGHHALHLRKGHGVETAGHGFGIAQVGLDGRVNSC